jgi:hypothetical protein
MAAAESLDQAQAVLFLLIITLGATLTAFPTLTSAKSMLLEFLTWEGAAWTLSAVIVARVAVAPYRIWQADQRKIKTLENRVAALSSVPPRRANQPEVRIGVAPGGRVWLSSAALTVYEELGNCELRRSIDRASKGDHDRVLDIIAGMIAPHVMLVGEHPPSTVPETIDQKEIAALAFCDGGATLRAEVSSSNAWEWEGLALDRPDLERATDAILAMRDTSFSEIG